MTGLELLKAPGTTAEQIVDIIAEQCPPITIAECDGLSCRKCWLAWPTTEGLPKEAGPSDKQTAPDEEGLHPNPVERFQDRQKQDYKEQLSANLIVTAVYQAILLHEDGDISVEKRLHLLEGLMGTYKKNGVGARVGRAHLAALDKVLGLFSPEFFQ